MVQEGTWRRNKTVWDELMETDPKPHFVTMDVIHSRVPEGKHFTTEVNFLGLGSSALGDLLIATSDIPLVILAAITADVEVLLSLYEDSQVSANGTELSIINYKRTGTVYHPNAKMYKSPTVDSYGTALIDEEFIPGGNFGGSSSDKRECFILKENSNYIFSVKNNSTSDGSVGAVASFYEEYVD